MSDETEGGEENVLLPLHFVAGEEDPGPALRWTPTTLLIDLLNSIGLVLEGMASFFNDQVRSLAARASLKEELADHAIRQKLKEDQRRQMQLHTLEDIAYLPGTQE